MGVVLPAELRARVATTPIVAAPLRVSGQVLLERLTFFGGEFFSYAAVARHSK